MFGSGPTSTIGDRLAESDIPFNSATWNNNALTLKENGTTVATFTNVTLASGSNTSFLTTTETINNTKYYVAYVDPPAAAAARTTGATGGSSPAGAAATGATGSSGAHGSSGAAGATGAPASTGSTGAMGPTGDGAIVVNTLGTGTMSVSDATLDVTGAVSGGTLTLDHAALNVTESMLGGNVTLNSSVMKIGGDTSRGSITYGSGVSAVELADIKHGANNLPKLPNLNNGDSIAESNIAFNSATWANHTLTLRENGTTVARFTDVTLNPGHTSSTFVASTEVVDGVTYYVATLDPPASGVVTPAAGPTGPAGVTGSLGGDHGSPATSGTTDRLTAAINSGNLTGPQDQAFAPRFLYTGSDTAGASGQPGTATGPALDVLVRAGTAYIGNFSLVQGDKLDLTQILAGAPLAHDLANIAEFVKVTGYGQNDAGFGPGSKTSLQITGPHGSALVNLEGAGKLELKDLLQHNSLLLPPH
jgi:hypothetical protein